MAGHGNGYCGKCHRWRKMYSVSGRPAAAAFTGCGHTFFWRTNTILEKSTTPIEKWLIAFCVYNENSDLTVADIKNTIDVNWRTSRRILNIFKEQYEDALMMYDVLWDVYFPTPKNTTRPPGKG